MYMYINETFVYSNRHPRMGDSYDSHTMGAVDNWPNSICCCYLHQKKNKGILRKVNVGNGSETGEVTRDPERLHVLEIDQEQQDVNFYCHHIDNRSIIIYLQSNVILSINFNMIQVTF